MSLRVPLVRPVISTEVVLVGRSTGVPKVEPLSMDTLYVYPELFDTLVQENLNDEVLNDTPVTLEIDNAINPVVVVLVVEYEVLVR